MDRTFRIRPITVASRSGHCVSSSSCIVSMISITQSANPDNSTYAYGENVVVIVHCDRAVENELLHEDSRSVTLVPEDPKSASILRVTAL